MWRCRASSFADASCLRFCQGLKKGQFAFLSALQGGRRGGGGGDCHAGDRGDERCSLTLSTLTPYRWPLREREDAGKCLQKLTSPLHRNHGCPMGSAGAAPGAWPPHFSVWADSVKNTHNSNDCEPKHLTTSFHFFPSKVVRQPFCSCTIGLNIQIFFLQYFILPN